VLVTGGMPSYLRAELDRDAGSSSEASSTALWWPPAKIVGHHLAPFLARLAGTELEDAPAAPGAMPVEIELDSGTAGFRRDRLLRSLVEEAGEREASVAEVMAVEPLVVAPEDTLGELAEQMQRRDVGSALVTEYGRLIGIVTSRDMLHAVAARVHSSEARVRQWMTAEPITVSPTTTLAVAKVLMADHGIHHLPVVEGERPVGMVGARDVLPAQVRIPVP
jgi:predicted transcriptional regulator